MKKKIETPDLTLEQMQEIVESKSNELSKKLGRKVMPLLFNHNDEWIVGYVQQPTRTVVRVAVDKMEKFGKIEAGDLILQSSLIKEESDQRIISEESEYDGVNMGACLEVLNLIDVSLSVVKKNTTPTK